MSDQKFFRNFKTSISSPLNSDTLNIYFFLFTLLHMHIPIYSRHIYVQFFTDLQGIMRSSFLVVTTFSKK